MNDMEQERLKQLIEEREEYERRFFTNIVDEMIQSESLDKLIADRLSYIDDHFDFEPSPAYERLEEIYHAEKEAKYKNNDPFDGFGEIDYPDESKFIRKDGLFDESLIDYEVEPVDTYPMDDPYIEVEDDEFNELSQEDLEKFYNQLVQEAVIDNYEEDENLEALIQTHLEEEKNFLENILIEAIEEDNLFEKAIDELIFNEIEMDYEPELFDYDHDDYWYNGHFHQADESTIDPYDEFEYIDYPEEPPSFEEQWNRWEYEKHMENIIIQEDVERDFAKYQRQKMLEFKKRMPKEEEYDFIDPDDIRNQQLILEREKMESLFKDYFTKDDTLDIIIKEKLKERKFNH